MYVNSTYRRRAVAVFSDELVDTLVLAEATHPGGQYNELSIVCDGHACAVDGLVAQPRRLELFWVQIHHHLVQWRLQELEVDLQRQLGSLHEALLVVSNEDSARHELAVLSAAISAIRSQLRI
jgi:ferritin-like protein